MNVHTCTDVSSIYTPIHTCTRIHTFHSILLLFLKKRSKALKTQFQYINHTTPNPMQSNETPPGINLRQTVYCKYADVFTVRPFASEASLLRQRKFAAI